MNLATLDWEGELLDAFRIPRAMLPRIASSSEVYGKAAIAPIEGVPLSGILGDQQAALVGQTCFHPGEAKNTYGTGCFLLMNTGTEATPSKHGMLTTVGYRVGAQPAVYALEGSVAITGALVQWIRDNFGLIEKSSDIEVLARTVKDNGGVYFVPAFSGLYAPYWKDNARGVIAGLTRYTNKGHLARAVLEATAFQTREVVEAMEKDSGIALDTLRTDGGMVSNDLLMQFQSDILDRPVVRPAVQETTALGAAYAAGLAVGFFQDTDDLRSRWSVDHTWKPQMDARPSGSSCTVSGRKRLRDPSTGSKAHMTSNFFRRIHGDHDPHPDGQRRSRQCPVKKSKAEGAGWIVITTGWAFAVMTGVFTAIACGSPDAHLNPAVGARLRRQHRQLLQAAHLPAGSVLGAMCGALLVWLHFLPHWAVTPIAIRSSRVSPPRPPSPTSPPTSSAKRSAPSC